jgi:hypothetical protein
VFLTDNLYSFKPINQIHQQLCGIHIYAHDPTRAVKAHHYCTHLREDLHQCVIYDSDEPGARLIGQRGIEYVIPESTFEKLDMDERKVRAKQGVTAYQTEEWLKLTSYSTGTRTSMKWTLEC